MGLIKNIGNAVKNEVRDYIFKMVENEKEKETAKQSVTENVQKNTEVKAEQPEPEIKEAPVVKEEKVEPEKTEEVEKAVEKPHKKEILPIARDLEILKFSYKKNQNVITIPRELSDLIKMLPLEEYACFIKLYCYSLEQKKNYGYWGGTLKRKIGLDDLTTAEFDEIGNNLVAYGLMLFEKLSEIQKTFVLYIPFDEENMVKLDAAKQPAKQDKTPKKTPEKPAPKAKEEPKKEEPETQRTEDIPGKPVEGMENDEMYKSYKTFVSLEIDKAKMRVGRANFDKIYMEAVKYIDKKYGFKVLSDSDKFKEYLTNYYISAFDIPTFENWKKSKG